MKISIVAVVTVFIITTMFSGCVLDMDYRQEMRDFVQNINDYANEFNSNFIVIPQNGIELITENGESDGNISSAYINAIDGVGQESLLYGYEEDNVATPDLEHEYMTAFLDVVEKNGVEVLVTDYCWTHSFVDSSYNQNNIKDYISFAADHRGLDNIPTYPNKPYNENDLTISSLSEARNFLYLIDPYTFDNKNDFIDSIGETNYDVIIIDLFYDETLTSSDIETLKNKANGGTRLLIAYISIGEAEDYRYYWQSEWETNPPQWLEDENPNWPGCHKVQYWDPEWQRIIYGNKDSYLKKILDAGFDGVYLDIIDAFEYFENWNASLKVDE